jgi:hypothetical protein
MQSIWDEVFSSGSDSYDSNIIEILFNSKALDHQYTPTKPVGKLEIFIEIFPYDEHDVRGETIYRRITAEGAYVFGFPAREFIVGQMLKQLNVYADIIRFDIVTTGSLLQFECDSYMID